MTYKELLNRLQGFTDDELSQEVFIPDDEEFYRTISNITKVSKRIVLDLKLCYHRTYKPNKKNDNNYIIEEYEDNEEENSEYKWHHNGELY